MANDDISGQITDGSGNPISSAEVYLWREDLVDSGGVVDKVVADSSGNFAFTAHPDGSGSSESWHVAAKDPNANVQLQSAYGVTASPPESVDSQFDVSITDTSPSSTEPGETFTVDALLTNSGTGSDTQTITLDINNGVGQVDSSLEAAQAGASKSVSLSWSVPSGQTQQDYQATVSSADSSASQTVTVDNPQLVFGFETGDFSRWRSAFSLDSISTTHVYEGNYSAFQNSDQSPVARLEPDELSGGAQPQEISWAYRETGSGSVGGAVAIYDSSGSIICGAGSSNPAHEVKYAAGWKRIGDGNGYKRWIVYTLSFDWNNGTFVATAEDTQANETFTSSSLELDGPNVERLELRPFSSPPTFDSGENHENWWDSFRIVL